MKKLVSLLFILTTVCVNAQSISVDAVRKEYYKLDTDSAGCAKLYNTLSKATITGSVLIGYKGAVAMAMANHAKSREEKIKLFNEGKKLLEQSIKTDSSNVELRFLRFTIQTNCPKLLGYYKQIDPDKKYMVDHFASLKNAEMKKKISDYLISGKYLSEEEKKKIKSVSN